MHGYDGGWFSVSCGYPYRGFICKIKKCKAYIVMVIFWIKQGLWQKIVFDHTVYLYCILKTRCLCFIEVSSYEETEGSVLLVSPFFLNQFLIARGGGVRNSGEKGKGEARKGPK